MLICSGERFFRRFLSYFSGHIFIAADKEAIVVKSPAISDTFAAVLTIFFVFVAVAMIFSFKKLPTGN